MATPKKKISRSRRNMRRFASGNKLKKPTITLCMQCLEMTRPHRICFCGSYNGEKILESKNSVTVSSESYP